MKAQKSTGSNSYRLGPAVLIPLQFRRRKKQTEGTADTSHVSVTPRAVRQPRPAVGDQRVRRRDGTSAVAGDGLCNRRTLATPATRSWRPAPRRRDGSYAGEGDGLCNHPTHEPPATYLGPPPAGWLTRSAHHPPGPLGQPQAVTRGPHRPTGGGARARARASTRAGLIGARP